MTTMKIMCMWYCFFGYFTMIHFSLFSQLLSYRKKYNKQKLDFFFRVTDLPLFRNFFLIRKQRLIYSISYKWHASVFYILYFFYWMTQRRLWFRFLDWMILVGFESGSLVLDCWTFSSDGQTFSVMDTLLPQIHSCTKNTTEKIKCFNMFPCMLAVKKRVVS